MPIFGSHPERRVIFLIAMLFVTVGCDSNKIEFAEVTGQVTSNGEPVPGARVMFVPVTARAENDLIHPISFAECDENGFFELEMPDKTPGAVVGKHMVMISKLEPWFLFNRQATGDEGSTSAEEKEPENEGATQTESTKSSKSSKVQVPSISEQIGIEKLRIESYLMANPLSTRRQPVGESIFSSFNIQSELTFSVKKSEKNEANFDVGLDPLLRR